MIRSVLLIAAVASLSGCALFQRDQCAADARAELRDVDARIAQTRDEARHSHAVKMPMNGSKTPLLCRERGGDMVACTALPQPTGSKLAYGWAAHSPKARLARLDAERQKILTRMMACQHS